jgi:hypothetical protein
MSQGGNGCIMCHVEWRRVKKGGERGGRFFLLKNRAQSILTGVDGSCQASAISFLSLTTALFHSTRSKESSVPGLAKVKCARRRGWLAVWRAVNISPRALTMCHVQIPPTRGN